MRRLGLLILMVAIVIVVGNLICSSPHNRVVQLHSVQKPEDTTNSTYSPFMGSYVADNGDIARAIERGEYDNTRDRGQDTNVQRRARRGN